MLIYSLSSLFVWLRWFSPPASWVCLICCWVQSAPCLQRRSVRRLEPVWMAYRDCWLPAPVWSSLTHSRIMDKVSTHIQNVFLSICHTITHLLHCQLQHPLISVLSSQYSPPLSLLLHLSHDLCLVLYSNTEQASVYLTRSSPLSLYQSIQYSSRTIYLCWHHLTDAVRSVHWARSHRCQLFRHNFTVERVCAISMSREGHHPLWVCLMVYINLFPVLSKYKQPEVQKPKDV